MRILIDMDDVIADAISRFLEWYERDFGISFSKEDLAGTKLRLIVPEEHRKIVSSYPHHKDFFKDLPVMPGSVEAVQKLHNKYEVYIASAAQEFPLSLNHKNQWLDEYFPFIHWKRRIFCGDKSVLKADVLIDDNDFNLSVFDGRRIMFSSPHNLNDRSYERLENWFEVEKLF